MNNTRSTIKYDDSITDRLFQVAGAQERLWFLDQLETENSSYNSETHMFPGHPTDLGTPGARSCLEEYISDPVQKSRNDDASQYTAVVLSSLPEIRQLSSISR